MSIAGKICRIVDHPVGWRPPLEAINCLVRAIQVTSMPGCCFIHMRKFAMVELENGEMWDCEALQHIKLNNKFTVPPGKVLTLPKKNLSPLPDVDDDEDIDSETDKPIEKVKDRELDTIK